VAVQRNGRPTGGRSRGQVDAETDAGAELANWLRRLVGDLPLRDLETKVPYGRTALGNYLNGRTLPTQDALRFLVHALVPPTRHQEMYREAQRLLAAAQAAEASHKTHPVLAATVEIQLRLDDARKAQIEAQRMTYGMTHIISNLLTVIAGLKDRCARLEEEKQQAIAQSRSSDAARIQDELATAEQRLTTADDRLSRAQDQRQDAEHLQLRAQQAEERHLREWQRLHPGTDATPPERDAGGLAVEPAPSPAATPLWEYDRYLENTDDQLDRHHQVLDDLRRSLDLDEEPADTSAPAGPADLPGGVVRDATADNPEAGKSGADNADIPGRPSLTSRLAQWLPQPRVTTRTRITERDDGVTTYVRTTTGFGYTPLPSESSAKVDLPSALGVDAAVFGTMAARLVLYAVGASAFTFLRWDSPAPPVWELASYAFFGLIIMFLANTALHAPLQKLPKDQPGTPLGRFVNTLVRLVGTATFIAALIQPHWVGPLATWGHGLAHALR
jgi:hypothetical protein